MEAAEWYKCHFLVLLRSGSGKGECKRLAFYLRDVCKNVVLVAYDYRHFLERKLSSGSDVTSGSDTAEARPGDITALLNLLGTFVHTSRLQYIEFFGKFYEDGGEAFEPFRKDTKYVKILEILSQTNDEVLDKIDVRLLQEKYIEVVKVNITSTTTR